MKRLVIGVLLLVGAAAALIFLLSSPEEKVIAALLRDGLAAAKRGDAEAVLGIVSRDYKSSENDYDSVVARIRRMVREPWLQGLGMKEPGVHVDGDQAQANVSLEMRAGVQVVEKPEVRVQLRKEKDGWRILAVEPLR